MASNTCFDIIIHPEFKPYHLNATHANISFGIAFRNLANKKSETTFVVQPINVALPSETNLVAQPTLDNSTEPEFIITSDSDVEDEQDNQWFRPGFLNQPLSSSSHFVLESIHEPPYVAPSQPISETSTIDTSSSSNQTCPQTLTTVVLPPPTLLLDSTILTEVCENIFKDLNRLVKTRNNFVREKICVDEWTKLRERVDYVM